MSVRLDVKNLSVRFKTIEGIVEAVDGVSFQVQDGQNIGVVGESGCGKSVLAQAILRILDKNGSITGGSVNFRQMRAGVETFLDIVQLHEKSEELLNTRGKGISMIFQEPMTSFCPVYKVGDQISEALMLHRKMTKAEARTYTIDLLRKVEISNPEQRFDEYPMQLSGGMRQRAMIAMALSCDPQLLIADEPTTALDVTVQAQVLDLLRHLQQVSRMSIMIISHNLGVIATLADVVMVMYMGRIVEMASTRDLFSTPLHPYTKALIESIPKVTESKNKELSRIKGDIPDIYHKPLGCLFHPRCPEFMRGVCDAAVPATREMQPGHVVSCFKYSEATIGQS